MPSPNTIDAPGIPMIEAVAGLDAAASVFIALAGGADTPLARYFSRLAWDLKATSLGEDPHGDGEYQTDPAIVEITARSDELAGEALHAFGMTEQANTHVAIAKRIRAQGSVGVSKSELDDA